LCTGIATFSHYRHHEIPIQLSAYARFRQRLKRPQNVYDHSFNVCPDFVDLRHVPMKTLLIVLPFVLLLGSTVCFAGEFEDGLAAYKRGDYKTAVAIWTIGANKGDAKAQNNLGLMCAKGLGVPQDYKQAVAWFRKAAERGDAEASNNLGLAYSKGLGVPRDDKRAVSWFRKAAEEGYAEAQDNLGAMYANGRGVSQDYKQAAAWIRKAAEKGSARAQIHLALLYEKGLGVPQDYAEARKWYGLAATNPSIDKEQRVLATKGSDNAAKKIKEAQKQAEASPEPAYEPCVAGPPALRVIDEREQKGLAVNAMRSGVPMTPQRLAEVYIADCSDSLAKLSSVTNLSNAQSGQLQEIVTLWQTNLDYMKQWLQHRRKNKQN
jgi:hypothetical protein